MIENYPFICLPMGHRSTRQDPVSYDAPVHRRVQRRHERLPYHAVDWYGLYGNGKYQAADYADHWKQRERILSSHFLKNEHF